MPRCLRTSEPIERGEELIPLEITERRLAAKAQVKIWREYRGLTQEHLAKVSPVSRPMIAVIEAGHKRGGIATLKKRATALQVDLNYSAWSDTVTVTSYSQP
jgi:predicted transcriptional regulator